MYASGYSRRALTEVYVAHGYVVRVCVLQSTLEQHKSLQYVCACVRACVFVCVCVCVCVCASQIGV